MLGNLLVVSSVLAGILAFVMYLLTLKGYENTVAIARKSYYAMTILTVAASFLLLYYIVNHNYEYKYVFDYSSGGLSFGLLLSTFFAGQEGSFLLWLLFNALIGLFIINRHKDDPIYESSVMLFYSLVCIFLGLLISPYLKNPFEFIWSDVNYLPIKYFNLSVLNLPQIQQFIFTNGNDPTEFVKVSKEILPVLQSAGVSFGSFLIEGKGLNPLLQNFWMQIHPPLLFVGFAFAAVPYSYAMSSFLRREYKSWIKEVMPWLSIGMMFLGLAIMIGGYWAYGVLGWGGYWGWDPVENSSLIPWILGIALIHTLIVQKQSLSAESDGRFAKTNLVLALLTFCTVLYSTFLTRSGILSDSSVHSFVDPGMLTYTFLSGFILTFLLTGLWFVIYRRGEIKSLQTPYKIFSRESVLFYGSAVLLGTAIIIITGTSAPIFGNAVEISFYNTMNLPLAILFLSLIGIGVFLAWYENDFKVFIRNVGLSVAIALLLTLVTVSFYSQFGILESLMLFAALFALVADIQIMYKKIRSKLHFHGGRIAHIGIALFFIGVIINGTVTKSSKVDLIKDIPVEVLDRTFKFTGYTPIEGGKKFAFSVEVTDENGIYIAKPVMYMSDFNNSLMREPDILEGVLHDLYISPLGYEEPEEKVRKNGISLRKNEPMEFNGALFTFTKFVYSDEDMKAMLEGKDYTFGAEISIEKDGKRYSAVPQMVFSGGKTDYPVLQVEELPFKLQIEKVDAAGGINLKIISDDKIENRKENLSSVLSVEIKTEPFISLVWIGTVVFSLGLFVSYLRRKREVEEEK